MTRASASRAWPLLAVVLASVLFGTTGTAKALAPVDASAFSIGMARIVVGGLVLAAIAFGSHLRVRSSARAGTAAQRTVDGKLGEHSRPIHSDSGSFAARLAPAGIVLVGALGVVCYQPTFFAGTESNGVAIGTVVALGSAPLMTGLLSWLVSRVVPGAAWWVATALAIVGVALLSGVARPVGDSGVSMVGIGAAIAAGASYAVYTVAAKALIGRGWGSMQSMAAIFGVAALLALPALLASPLGWLAQPSGVFAALWLGLVATTLAYLLFGRGLRDLAAPTVATLTLVEPVTAALLGVGLLGEVLGLDAVIGIAVLASGIVVLSVSSAKSQGLPDSSIA